jgi:hypothetical protein
MTSAAAAPGAAPPDVPWNVLPFLGKSVPPLQCSRRNDVLVAELDAFISPHLRRDAVVHSLIKAFVPIRGLPESEVRELVRPVCFIFVPPHNRVR